jgi:SOS-response transcriptional repressor LexA
MIALTKRQAETLDYIERQEVPPTLREIGSFMGIRSTNGVNDHLTALARKGRIVHRDINPKTRQIRVIHPLTLEERMVYKLGDVSRCSCCGHVLEGQSLKNAENDAIEGRYGTV